jgi:hypothetical protein
VQPRRAAGGARRADGGGQLRLVVDPEVDVGVDGGREVLPRRVQPGQHGYADAGRPQGQRLLEEGDPQPARPASNGGPRARQQAVAVAVRLDDGHHLRPAGCPGSERGDVVADGGQVDPRGRPHGWSLMGTIFPAAPRTPP